MPLLRSRMDVHKARARFVARFYVVITAVVVAFIVIVGVHYLLGWW